MTDFPKALAEPAPPRRTNWIPSRKWLSGGLGGVISYFIVLEAGKLGFPIPVELQGMLPGIVMGIIYYLMPSAKQDIVRNLDNEIVGMAVADPASPVTQSGIAAAVQENKTAAIIAGTRA